MSATAVLEAPEVAEVAEVAAKRCPGCGETKPAGAFARNRSRADGLASYCRECALARQRRHYAENAESVLARQRRHYAENAELDRARRRRRYAGKGERWRKRRRDRRRRRYAENPERERERCRRRRALARAAAVGDFTPEDVAARMAMFGDRCAYRTHCDGAPYTEVEHVKPLDGGGPHMLANFRPACRSCNASKGARWPYPAVRLTFAMRRHPAMARRLP